ncbi:prepilin-type N-terminal cleavage/methylation domain-containing protein [Clostridium sp.]|uniref:type II secretion system protein n=1 Tax=Clostridium sp. TaxID=1506 RepID=UPI0032178089
MKNKKIKRDKKKGFTLMELIVVMGIISVLVFITAPTFISKIEDAKLSADIANAKSIATAVKTELLEGKLEGNTTLTETEKNHIVNTYFDGELPKPQSIKDGNFQVSIVSNKVSVNVGGKEFYPNYVKDEVKETE